MNYSINSQLYTISDIHQFFTTDLLPQISKYTVDSPHIAINIHKHKHIYTLTCSYHII